MTIEADSALLEPGNRLQFMVLDATMINPTAGILYFHGYNQEGKITWQGRDYFPWPLEATGFQRTTERPPTPTLAVSNINGSITSLCLMYEDLVGAVLTVKSTLAKYLDAVNFPGGVNPTASPTEEFPDEIWYIERKESEDRQTVKWNLSSALDFNGVQLPRRLIVANMCYWKYRSAECSYAGGPVADIHDNPTSNPALDDCSRKVSGCKKRFGDNNPLPYGSFPAAGLMRT
jgi:lambda family phage minor tail protein L